MLLDQTLVVLGTEFGRTPWINGNDGRDHHDEAFTCLLAEAEIGCGEEQLRGDPTAVGHGGQDDERFVLLESRLRSVFSTAEGHEHDPTEEQEQGGGFRDRADVNVVDSDALIVFDEFVQSDASNGNIGNKADKEI